MLTKVVKSYDKICGFYDDNDKMTGPSDEIMIAAMNGLDLLPLKRKKSES